jgi:Zn-finger nucleic acid-binding protein
MREATARARTGYLIVLDQCPACGGVWCDRWELFPLSSAEARRLDPVEAERLHAPNSAPETQGVCPRCEIELRPFRDPLLPSDARIERCRVCDGMWLNRGELRRIKEGKSPMAPPSAADVERLAERLGAAATWSKVKDIDAALHAVDDPSNDPDELRSALWSASAWIALQALLRLLFRA